MLRAISIFLIGVHLMNIIGSYGIIASLEMIHQQKISDELDQDQFAGSDAITLRIPFSLPYPTFNDSYERASGRIEYDDQIYYMVKQKFHNDTLFIVCVKDIKSAEIQTALENVAASMTDTPHKNSSGKLVSLQVKDFDVCDRVELAASLLPLESLGLPEYAFSAKIHPGSGPDQPPKV